MIAFTKGKRKNPSGIGEILPIPPINPSHLNNPQGGSAAMQQSVQLPRNTPNNAPYQPDNTWEDRVENLVEKIYLGSFNTEDCKICHIFKIDNPDDVDPITQRLLDQALEWMGKFDFIGQALFDEIKARFGGDVMITCFNQPNCELPQEPIESSENFRYINPSFPREPPGIPLRFPTRADGYILVVNTTNLKCTGSRNNQSYSKFYGTPSNYTAPINQSLNQGIKYVTIPPGGVISTVTEYYQGFADFFSNQCNGYGSDNKRRQTYLTLNGEKLNIIVGWAEWGYSYQISEKQQGCPGYTVTESAGTYSCNSNFPEFSHPPVIDPPLTTRRVPPPLPPKRKRKKRMSCCDCRTINLIVNRAKKEILNSIGKFPITIDVPVYNKVQQRKVKSVADAIDTITYHDARIMAEFYGVIEPRDFDGKGFGIAKELMYPDANGIEYHRSLGGVLEAIIRQIDRAVGKFPTTIKVKDANPAIKGDQSVELDIHSISDGIKAIAQYLIDTSGDVDAANNMQFRSMMTAGLVQQIVAVVDSKVEAIIDFLNIKTKYKTRKMPMAFDPTAGNTKKVGFGDTKIMEPLKLSENTEQALERVMPAILRNIELPVRLVEYDEKDKMLTDWLIDITRKVSVCAAALSLQGKPDKIASQIDALKLLSWAERIVSIQDIERMLGVDRLSKWEEDAENSYPETPGKWETNPNEVYGKPASQKPSVKIRQSKKRKRR